MSLAVLWFGMACLGFGWSGLAVVGFWKVGLGCLVYRSGLRCGWLFVWIWLGFWFDWFGGGLWCFVCCVLLLVFVSFCSCDGCVRGSSVLYVVAGFCGLPFWLICGELSFGVVWVWLVCVLDFPVGLLVLILVVRFLFCIVMVVLVWFWFCSLCRCCLVLCL